MAERDEISVLVMAVERLAESQTQMANDMRESQKETKEELKSLNSAITTLSIAMTEFSHIKTEIQDANKRIHKRIDEAILERKNNLADIIKKVNALEHYMLNDGCPAHKSFLIGYNMRVERQQKAEHTINETLKKVSDKIQAIEDTPKVALGKIGNAILAVFGTTIGAWLLFKFGLKDK